MCKLRTRNHFEIKSRDQIDDTNCISQGLPRLQVSNLYDARKLKKMEGTNFFRAKLGQ